MRTAINATWVVGHENGRHTLIHDGSVVYENNRIVHVGRRFDGQVDRTVCFSLVDRAFIQHIQTHSD
jgi:hypothetical protein